MPENTRFEYIAGTIYPNEETNLFAYLWFKNIHEAINYVQLKGMKIEGGWNG